MHVCTDGRGHGLKPVSMHLCARLQELLERSPYLAAASRMAVYETRKVCRGSGMLLAGRAVLASPVVGYTSHPPLEDALPAVSLLACLLACLLALVDSACLLALVYSTCLRACLLACLLACFCACLRACFPLVNFACLLSFLVHSACCFSFLLCGACLHACLLACLLWHVPSMRTPG